MASIDAAAAVLVKPKLARAHLSELIVQLPPCLIGMEACSGAHHWARKFRHYGHTVKLMAPKFVSPSQTSGNLNADTNVDNRSTATPRKRTKGNETRR